MFYSELEAPGFHQKADVLEEIKLVGKLIHRRKDFFFFFQFNSVQHGDWDLEWITGLKDAKFSDAEALVLSREQ